MKIKLGGVPETLLITVRARAEETLRKDALLKDPYAIEILQEIDFDTTPDKKKVAASSKIGVIIRTIILDKIATGFMQKNPDGIIISLGCGLDARYKRIADGKISWYDLDVKEAIEIRKAFFQEEDNYKMISGSMFDYSWMDQIPKGKPVLILSEGVMMYFPEDQIRPLLNTIFNTFDKVEMAFDTIAPFLAKRTKLHSEVKKYDAKFQWGLRSAEELTRWNSKIRIKDVIYYFDYFPKRWPLGIRLATLFPAARKWNKIVHIGS